MLRANIGLAGYLVSAARISGTRYLVCQARK